MKEIHMLEMWNQPNLLLVARSSKIPIDLTLAVQRRKENWKRTTIQLTLKDTEGPGRPTKMKVEVLNQMRYILNETFHSQMRNVYYQLLIIRLIKQSLMNIWLK